METTNTTELGFLQEDTTVNQDRLRELLGFTIPHIELIGIISSMSRHSVNQHFPQIGYRLTLNVETDKQDLEFGSLELLRNIEKELSILDNATKGGHITTVSSDSDSSLVLSNDSLKNFKIRLGQVLDSFKLFYEEAQEASESPAYSAIFTLNSINLFQRFTLSYRELFTQTPDVVETQALDSRRIIDNAIKELSVQYKELNRIISLFLASELGNQYKGLLLSYGVQDINSAKELRLALIGNNSVSENAASPNSQLKEELSQRFASIRRPTFQQAFDPNDKSEPRDIEEVNTNSLINSDFSAFFGAWLLSKGVFKISGQSHFDIDQIKLKQLLSSQSAVPSNIGQLTGTDLATVDESLSEESYQYILENILPALAYYRTITIEMIQANFINSIAIYKFIEQLVPEAILPNTTNQAGDSTSKIRIETDSSLTSVHIAPHGFYSTDKGEKGVMNLDMQGYEGTGVIRNLLYSVIDETSLEVKQGRGNNEKVSYQFRQKESDKDRGLIFIFLHKLGLDYNEENDNIIISDLGDKIQLQASILQYGEITGERSYFVNLISEIARQKGFALLNQIAQDPDSALTITNSNSVYTEIDDL